MPMTDEHKKALAQGRKESRIIKSYLKALHSRKPGRPVTASSVKQKINNLEKKIDSEPDPLKRVELVQARLDAQDQLAQVSDSGDLAKLEKEFVDVAKSYSERKGITYSAWREEGVPAAVLREAGIPRTRRS